MYEYGELWERKGKERGLTIARGNWSSMKREMEGKILSDVRGASEVNAAVAKELKATSTVVESLVSVPLSHRWQDVQGIPLHNDILSD